MPSDGPQSQLRAPAGGQGMHKIGKGKSKLKLMGDMKMPGAKGKGKKKF